MHIFLISFIGKCGFLSKSNFVKSKDNLWRQEEVPTGRNYLLRAWKRVFWAHSRSWWQKDEALP
jgi:hypothetical protein